MTEKELAKQYAQILLKAWNSEDFKQTLIADPKAVLAAEGMPIPDEITVRLAVDSNEQSFDPATKVLTLPLPATPESGLEIAQVNSDYCCCCCPCCSCCC